MSSEIVTWNWKNSFSFLIGFASWFYYLLIIVLDMFPGRWRFGLDSQLWMLGILDAFWLLSAVGFLFGCASWWEQKKSLRKLPLATLGGCIFSGGFILFPVFGFLIFYFFKH